MEWEASGSVAQEQEQELHERVCSISLNLLIKPCFCIEIGGNRRRFNDTGMKEESLLWGNWLNCDWTDLNDNKMSGISNAFLSIDANRELTRAISLEDTGLTKVPDEIYQFKRLQNIYLSSN